MNLATALEQETNWTYTENGALTHQSSLSNLLDLFAMGAAQRSRFNIQLFSKAFAENPVLATVCAFYIRGVREGQGERDTFRKILSWLADVHPDVFNKALPFVAEFGRWDDVLDLIRHEKVGNNVVNLLKEQFRKDRFSENPSLLAKWLPSENTSSKQSRRDAAMLAEEFGLSKRLYRKNLSTLREKLKVVERAMSAKNWEGINYSHVPSKASLIYRKAFYKHDQTRYSEFVEAAKKGEVKINSATLYPYELVSKYLGYTAKIDQTVEAQWSQLPNYCKTEGDFNPLAMCDLSGSMGGRPMEVSISLGIYLAERMPGFFKNQFISFTRVPTLHKIEGSTLFEKVKNMRLPYAENTDLQAAFNLILSAAVKHKVPANEMPTHLFIISDMEFDGSCGNNSETNFQTAKRKFAEAGYELPVVVFWNVNARSQQSPVKKDERGVYLVSGCSPTIFKAAINTKAETPLEMMLEKLNEPRYEGIKAALTA